jgi:poly-gamma-glutamate synthesis protein (capsule biosynthesis protein)
MENGKVTGITLYPVDLGMGMPSSQIGWPRMEKGNETLEYLAELSAAYGTAIRIENGVGYIDL